jgi:hypothetical protein
MTTGFVFFPIALAIAATAVTPALAQPECLANGKSFQLGQSTCLTLAGQSYLARCDKVLNNSSWTKVEDTCPGDTPAPHPAAPSTTPAPNPVPAEPTAN